MVRNADPATQYTEDDQPQYMAVSLGRKKFLVEQSSIAAIEALSDVDRSNPSDNTVGWLLYNNIKLPVYSFTDQFDVEESVSDNKAICVVLKHQEPCAAMMCTEATPVKHFLHRIQPLPECIKASPTPIESLCLYKTGDQSIVNFVISAKSLVDYVTNRSGM